MKIDRLLSEATVASKNTHVAMTKVIAYLQRKLGVKLIKLPQVERYHNSKDEGYGIRYVIHGTIKCIRFNSHSGKKEFDSFDSIDSIDYFNGKSSDPSFSFHTRHVSFALILPMIAEFLQNPHAEVVRVFPVSAKDALRDTTEIAALSESVNLSEAKRDDFSAEAALSDFLHRLASGAAISRTDFANMYHTVNVGIFDTAWGSFKDRFVADGKRLSIKSGESIEALKADILTKAGSLIVTTGGSGEEILANESEEETEEEQEHVSFGETLDHLEGLTKGLVKGAFNALLVAGKGGTGKTQTVERVLHEMGLEDGNGYFKNTGSASAIGIYTLLYQKRKDIILFDDCDGALADQDGRNLIKAATDTKKVRKMAWNKKSSMIFDPDLEDPETVDPEMAPKYFNFEGRIIFISNLPLKKLDPDGALRTRAFIINVNPTDEELIEHMQKILHEIKLEPGLHLTSEARQEVLEVIKSSKRKKDVSLRKLVRALNIAATPAIGDWRRLVDLYA